LSSNLDALVAALEAEFTLEVVFQPALPTALTAPSVVVVPSDPFIQPRTGAANLVEESWDILCAVNISEVGPGIDLMRDLSLRVRKAASGTGATWRSASGPRRLATEQSNVVFSINEVTFYYDPAQHLI
jgi:hypothetical protein